MHEQHRSRMRERYLQEGFDHFQPHELLEMLLYYARPRGDTNPTAHALIERFGTIKSTMEATVDELKEIEGMGDQSAILIKLTMALMRQYAIEAYNPKRPSFNRMEDIGMFIAPKFVGLDHEQLHLMLFNNRMQMLDYCIVSDGVVNSSDAPSRFIAERAYKKKAAFAILAHNHPNGIVKPSADDLDVTEYIRDALDMMGIILLEHIIVSEYRFYPILQAQYRLQGYPSPMQSVNQDATGMFDEFYGKIDGAFDLDPLF